MTPILRVLLMCAALLAATASPAATYYIRSGGDDQADGTSHDRAWATLGKAKNYGFAPGDRLLLHEGDRFEGQLIINWSGTAAEKAIVGAYYLEHGRPVRGFRTARPKIDGNDEIPQQYDGLVRVRGNRVRVENLDVANSEGRGIQFEGVDQGEVFGCMVDNTYKSAIKFVNSPNGLIENNRVSLAGMANPEDGSTWGGALELVASNNGRIVGNEVLRVYGEGINANHGSRNAIIEDNLVFAARAVGIYLDAAPDATVRRNIVLGTVNPEFWRTNQSVGAGIALNNERYHYESADRPLSVDVQTRNAKIYGNLVAFTNSGIGFWGQFDETSFADVMVFNNTFVDNDIQVLVRQRPKPGARFLNNIMLSMTPGTQDTDDNTLGGMATHNNFFSQGDPGGEFSHPSNVYEGLTLAKMSGWRAISNPSQLSWEDFSPEPGSSVIGAGAADPLSLSQGSNSFHLDFNRHSHNTPMDIGAVRFADIPLRAPKRPTDVAGTPH